VTTFFVGIEDPLRRAQDVAIMLLGNCLQEGSVGQTLKCFPFIKLGDGQDATGFVCILMVKGKNAKSFCKCQRYNVEVAGGIAGRNWEKGWLRRAAVSMASFDIGLNFYE
jgi:hypothetical protein